MNKLPSHVGRQNVHEAACQGKEKHDRANANMIARKMRSPTVTTYLCRFCGHWHLGQKKRK